MFKKVALITFLISLPGLSFGMQQGNMNQARVARNPELRSAATRGDIDRLRKELAGEDVNAPQDDKGWALLHYAAEHGRLNVVAELLERGAFVNAQTSNAQTPLHWAAHNGHLDVAKLLLQHGAQVDAPTDYGSTPLHYAAREGHSHIIALLLQNGAVIDARGVIGNTPLDDAANHWGATELLVQHGASLYALGEDGCTPLHRQPWPGDLKTADVFLDALMAKVLSEPCTFSTHQSLPNTSNDHRPPPQKRARKSGRST